MRIEEELLVIFVQYYNKTKVVPYSYVAKFAILKMYNQFVREQLLIPIEDLKQEDKMKLFNTVKEKNKPKTKQEIISTCKILSVINLINEQ